MDGPVCAAAQRAWPSDKLRRKRVPAVPIRAGAEAASRGATTLQRMLLGVHVSTAGRIFESLDRAKKLGCNTMQIFARNPQRFRRETPLDPADIEEFKRRRKLYKINPVFIHIPYLINLASPKPSLYHASIEAYVEDMRDAELLGADYIVTHMGSHTNTSEELGLRRLIKALKIILARTADSGVGILLENTAGSGSWLGYDFIHHKRIISELGGTPRIGACLDTAHAFLAGYDMSSDEAIDMSIDEIVQMTGAGRLKLIHLNDAAGVAGSHHDRHQHIGKGGIGKPAMQRLINHPALQDLPFILETPKSSATADKNNLQAVRRLRALTE
jgi:deoxyribonuclease-4